LSAHLRLLHESTEPELSAALLVRHGESGGGRLGPAYRADEACVLRPRRRDLVDEKVL
jgi:hypothetical protein